MKLNQNINRAARVSAGTALVLAGCLTGCTHHAAAKQKLDSKLLESARVNNQAAHDSLNLQRTEARDAFTETARTFLEQNERVLGQPLQPLEVESLVARLQQAQRVAANPETAGSPASSGPDQRNADSPSKSAGSPMVGHSAGASSAMPRSTVLPEVKRLFSSQNRLLQNQRRESDRLIALGEKQEAQRNARISFWARVIGFVTLPIGAVVALMVLVPVSIPCIGRLLAWLVGKLPSLAGYVGVVSTRAFDAVVSGIERFRQEAVVSSGTASAAVAGDPVEKLQTNLSRVMDSEHKNLVRRRKDTLVRSDGQKPNPAYTYVRTNT